MTMTYGHGWPFGESRDGYADEARDEAEAEQAEREARQDRAADHAPAKPGWPTPSDFVWMHVVGAVAAIVGAIVTWSPS